jgi:hypothetical protein
MTLNALPGWATNTNYSTGPDSGTPTKVDPSSAANGFISEVVAAPQHVNYLIATLVAELLKAVDGEGGGTYTPADDLEFTGSKTLILDLDVELTAGHTLELEGAIHLPSSGRINLASGAVIGLNSGASLIAGSGGIVELDSGSALNAAFGSTVSLAGTVNLATSGILAAAGGSLHTVASGALISVASGGEIRLARAADLKIASETCFWRSPMIPAWISLYSNAGVITPAWAVNDEAASGGWDLNDVGAANMIRIPLNRLPGDILTSISMSINGGKGAGHGGNISSMTMPKIQLVKVSSVGTKTIVASTSDTTSSAATYDADHSVTLDAGTDTLSQMPVTVTGDPWFIEVIGEHGTHSVATTLRLNSIFGQSTSKAYRSSIEFA